jgi:formylglycine-generating enzyme required for sulfatase activity
MAHGGRWLALPWLALLVACGGDDDGAAPDASAPDEMIEIGPATFLMGCNESVEDFCNPDEYPYHEVSLGAYAIDRREVTQADYQECVDDGACEPVSGNDAAATPDLPLVYTTYALAETFCAWAGKRLPSEAEWEYTARGDDGRRYPWGNEDPTCTLVNMTGCENAPAEVGSRPAGASPFGALDMAGNVSEWVADWYDEAYYATSPAEDPAGPAAGTLRILRGGNYAGGDFNQRLANREEMGPDPLLSYTGCRCAR